MPPAECPAAATRFVLIFSLQRSPALPFSASTRVITVGGVGRLVDQVERAEVVGTPPAVCG